MSFSLLQMLWFDKLTNRFSVAGQPSYTYLPRSLSQSKGLVNDGSYAFTDPVVRQAHQPVQGDRVAVIHIPCPVPELSRMAL